MVKQFQEARALTPLMVRAVAKWVEQEFAAKNVSPVKHAMGEVPTSGEQSTRFGTSSASTASTAKRSRH